MDLYVNAVNALIPRRGSPHSRLHPLHRPRRGGRPPDAAGHRHTDRRHALHRRRAGWLHARLIPTYGIRSQEEQEKRATSCLLAVMHGVPEFGHALLAELGAPKSPGIDTFAEVRFKNAEGKTTIPDGAIVCERGGKRWTCLVEVKTGSAMLKDEQVGGYLDIARDQGFDGVLTISNQITHSASESPVCVDGRKLRRAKLWHFSWWRVLTEAVVQSRYRGVSDPDQAWVLRELIHYLSSEGSGSCRLRGYGRALGARTQCSSRWNPATRGRQRSPCGRTLGAVHRVPVLEPVPGTRPQRHVAPPPEGQAINTVPAPTLTDSSASGCARSWCGLRSVGCWADGALGSGSVCACPRRSCQGSLIGATLWPGRGPRRSLADSCRLSCQAIAWKPAPHAALARAVHALPGTGPHMCGPAGGACAAGTESKTLSRRSCARQGLAEQPNWPALRDRLMV